MEYYFTKELKLDFEEAKQKAVEGLKTQGFGVLTEIDIQSTLKKKLDVDFYKYQILGACSPQFAYKALQAEDKIGTMLPCNVIIQQKQVDGPVEVSAVNPVASMQAITNSELQPIATEVESKLKQFIQNL